MPSALRCLECDRPLPPLPEAVEQALATLAGARLGPVVVLCPGCGCAQLHDRAARILRRMDAAEYAALPGPFRARIEELSRRFAAGRRQREFDERARRNQARGAGQPAKPKCRRRYSGE